MPSEFDDLYLRLFGATCSKEGQAYERICAAVTKLIAPAIGVIADKRLRGTISKSLYQIDVFATDGSKASFGEAKDYTERSKKVGRPDLQKLAGGLPELDVAKGVFYSATDYSREAKKYAKGSERIVGKPIELMHVRLSTEKDEVGRIQKIILNIHVSVPDEDKAKYVPRLTIKGQELLKSWRPSPGQELGEQRLKIDQFYDAAGKPSISVPELTANGFGGDFEKAWGSFLMRGHFLKWEGMLLELRGLEYLVPFQSERVTVEIRVTGKPVVLIKSEDGRVKRLVTDEQLRSIKFSDDGEVIDT